jgi:hypothetical protein
MIKETVLFISNSKFIDNNTFVGGVKSCTNDFRKTIESAYNVELFPIEFHTNLVKKIKRKLGFKGYSRYKPSIYAENLMNIIEVKSITKIFLNNSNTILFGQLLKKINPQIKIILCSHGNESGDYLHDIVRFGDQLSTIQKSIAKYNLGDFIFVESYMRKHFIDCSMVVSQVEKELENWLGAKKVFQMSPCIIPEFIEINTNQPIVGFVGDLSHPPNYYGLHLFCKEIVNQNLQEKITLRIVGKAKGPAIKLKKEFDFIEVKGYLTDEELKKEMYEWMFFLNAVYYYSKGISTKLALALTNGIPALSTQAGNRGYLFSKGHIMDVSGVQEQVLLFKQLSEDRNKYDLFKNNFLLSASSTPNIELLGKQLFNILRD